MRPEGSLFKIFEMLKEKTVNQESYAQPSYLFKNEGEVKTRQ